MKYMNYIINGNINIDSIVSKNKILKPPTIILGILVSAFGVVVLIGMIPFAGVGDTYRYGKLKYYKHLAVKNRQRYIKKVCLSLSVSKTNRIRFNNIINELVA